MSAFATIVLYKNVQYLSGSQCGFFDWRIEQYCTRSGEHKCISMALNVSSLVDTSGSTLHSTEIESISQWPLLSLRCHFLIAVAHH